MDERFDDLAEWIRRQFETLRRSIAQKFRWSRIERGE